jgi:hypothetical protein
LPSKFAKEKPFELLLLLNKTSSIKNKKSYCIIVSKQLREFTLVNTISSVDNTKPPKLLPSHTAKEIYKDDL